jgi:hypothetical protein
MSQRPYTVVLLVPTGIGAAIGGYAGDALAIARAVADIADCLITHPNVMNGAQLYWPLPNALYVEGYGLDQFAAGLWSLRPVHQNRIGLLLDRSIEPELQLRHLQAANAVQATLGLALTDYVVTDEPLGVCLQQAASGATWGTIQQPDSLLRGAEALIKKAGAEAIAVVARFPDDTDSLALQNYRQGQGVDPLAGAEAVISHLVVRTFRVPCAHAPALQPLPLDPTVSPRSAAEELGYTFLPCVLVGLSRAPQFVVSDRIVLPQAGDIWANQVDAIVLPETACGGSAVLNLAERLISGIPTPRLLVAVQDNKTTLEVTPDALGIAAVRVRSYLEALGVLVAHRSGVSYQATQPVIRPLQPLEGNAQW